MRYSVLGKIIDTSIVSKLNINYITALGNMKNQIVGPISFRGMKLTIDELEYMLGKVSPIELILTQLIITYKKYQCTNQMEFWIIPNIFIQAGAVETSIKSDPKPQVQDVMMSSLRNGNGANNEDSSDDNDWQLISLALKT